MATNNQFKVVDDIAKNILARLQNSLAITATANRNYENPFRPDYEFKIGDTLRIQKPVYYEGTKGAALKIEAIEERQDYLTIDGHAQVSVQLTSAQIQRFLMDPENNIYAGAAARIANMIDSDGSRRAQQKFYRTVGTAGAGVTSFSVPNLAITKQRQFGVVDSKYMSFNPGDAGTLRNSLQNSFNEPFNTEISQRAIISRLGGHDLYEDQNIQVHTTGTFAGTALVDGAGQTGSTIDLKGFTASQSGVLVVGDKISFAGVYALNQNNYQQIGTSSSGNLAQFSVQSIVDSNDSGLATVTISPALEVTGPYRNVTASPADNAPVTCVGIVTPGTAVQYSSNYVYSDDAFTFVCVPPPEMLGAAYCKVFTDSDTGISIRCIIDYFAGNDSDTMRFDAFYGWQAFGEYGTTMIG